VAVCAEATFVASRPSRSAGQPRNREGRLLISTDAPVGDVPRIVCPMTCRRYVHTNESAGFEHDTRNLAVFIARVGAQPAIDAL